MAQTIKIEKCSNPLVLCKAIKETTHCALATAKNIVKGLKTNGNVICLNDGSPITPENWENITHFCDELGCDLVWQYMH